MSEEHQEELSGGQKFWKFVWENKVWWLTPTLLVIILLVLIVVLTQGTSIAPFFYSLF